MTAFSAARRRRAILGLLIAAIFLFSAGVCSAAEWKAVPGGIRYEHIGDYTVERLNAIMSTELKNFGNYSITYPPATNAVGLYRVIYPTCIPEKSNKPVEASGLVAVPRIAATSLPVVSYQHGTVFSRTEVPSYPEQTTETRLMVARFAGQGYVVVAPDYIGKGFSTEPDSYMAKDSIVQACVDMLGASRAVCSDLKIEQGALFLSGWSQGAWNTMVLRNRLETLGVPVKAAATACTPTDVYLMLASYINNPNELDAEWLPGIFSLILNGYESYYEDMQGLSSSAILPRYWQTARDFYDNKIGWAQASKVFPKTVRELLQPEFMAQSSTLANRFFKRVRENDAYQWRYLTPSCYYYGKADEVIRPYVGTLPVEYQKILGGAQAQAVYAGDKADHRGTFLFGVLHQKQWFDSLLHQK